MLKKDNIEKIRHSLSHILAMAILEYDPGAKLGIGPVIDNGFYYDFELERPLGDSDLSKLEFRMREILSDKLVFQNDSLEPLEAREFFESQPYKLELIDEIVKVGKKISTYSSGSLTDLCEGPHVGNTNEINPDAFKLDRIAGAYWKGSEKNKMLTRIYGLAFESKKELDEYLKLIEESKERDHKKLGKELDLFYIDENVGKGLPMWTPKGTVIKKALENYTYELEKKYGYEHVSTPYLGHENLYKTSGHLEHYNHSMYRPIDMDGDTFYLRPMSCPHHIKLLQRKPLSFRDLPVRYAEIASMNRFERSGELMGLIRVRSFELTDAHIFLRTEDLKEELKKVCAFVDEAINGLGLKDHIWYRFSKHDPKDKEKYYSDEKLWNKSEHILKEILDELGLKYEEVVGEAAFYGPKLDVQIRNVNGKEDTIVTIQLDFLQPERFKIEYTDTDGAKRRPVMIHRSAIGSLERTTAFLIEHYAGALPMWLSPLQVAVLPIAETHKEYANNVCQKLIHFQIRATMFDNNETLGKKIKKVKEEKIPYFLVIGDNELKNNTVTLETRDGNSKEEITPADLVERLKKEIVDKK